MATTKITSEREAIRVGTTQHFKVYVLCTDGGDLPNEYLFVKKIVDPADPQQDIFERIVEIVDFDEITPNRNFALANGDTYFRDSSFTKLYTDLEVATAAVDAIRDRLNTLATDYTTYDETFVTTGAGEETEYPSTDPTEIQELKDAYSTARAAYVAIADKFTPLQAEADLMVQYIELYSGLSNSYSQWIEYIGDITSVSNSTLSFWKQYNDNDIPYYLTEVDRFISSYADVFKQYQTPMVRITLDEAGYTDIPSGAIASSIYQNPSPPGSTGAIAGFDNDDRTVLVTPATTSDVFPAATPQTINITGQSGSWTQSDPGQVIQSVGAFGPNIQRLKGMRDWLFQQTSDLGSKNSRFEAAALAAMALMETSMNTAVLSNEALTKQSADQLASVRAQASEIVADADTAYAAVQKAYEAVKAVCPNWTPDAGEEFPPAPEFNLDVLLGD